MARSTALMVGAIFGFVAGVLFGSMSRTAVGLLRCRTFPGLLPISLDTNSSQCTLQR